MNGYNNNTGQNGRSYGPPGPQYDSYRPMQRPINYQYGPASAPPLYNEPSPVASVLASNIGSPISHNAPTFTPQIQQHPPMSMSHPAMHQPSMAVGNSGVSNYEILEYLIRIDERLKSMNNRLLNVETAVQRVGTNMRPQPKFMDEEELFYRNASNKSQRTLQTNCARTLLSLADAQRTSDTSNTESEMQSPISSSMNIINDNINKETSASSSLSAAATGSSSGSNDSVIAAVDVVDGAQGRKRPKLSKAKSGGDGKSTQSAGGEGNSATVTNVSSWMKMTQKLLCETSLFPPDSAVTFRESSRLLFGRPEDYLTRMSAKSLQTVMTTFRAKLKKAIMDNLDYVVDLNEGETLNTVCQVLLRGTSYMHDGEKLYQSPTLAKALCLMFQFDEDLVAKWNWNAYPLTCVAFGLVSLKFCLEHPSTDGHRVPNRNGQHMYDETLKTLKDFIATNPVAYDQANIFLFEFGKREAKRLKEMLQPAKLLLQQRLSVIDRVTRNRSTVESNTNGYEEEYEHENPQGGVDEEDYFAPNDSYPRPLQNTNSIQYEIEDDSEGEGSVSREDEEFVPGIEKNITSYSNGNGPGRKKRRKSRKSLSIIQSPSTTPAYISVVDSRTSSVDALGRMMSERSQMDVTHLMERNVGGRQASSAIAHFWMTLHRWAAENNMFFIEQKVIEDACESAFGNRERYLDNSPRSIDANFSTWRGAMKRFMLDHLDDVVGLRPGQNLLEHCQAMLASNQYLHNGDKLYQSEVLSRAFFHIFYDEGLEYSSRNWNWTTIPIAALAFTISILKFCLQNPGAMNTVHRKGRDSYLELARQLEEFQARHPAAFEAARNVLWTYAKAYGNGKVFNVKNVRTS